MNGNIIQTKLVGQEGVVVVEIEGLGTARA